MACPSWAERAAPDLFWIPRSVNPDQLLEDVAARCRHLGYLHGTKEGIFGAQRRQELHVEFRQGEG